MHLKNSLFLLLVAACLPLEHARADEIAADPEFDAILALDIAELTVTSASKRAQKLNDVPAAVYVVTQEDLKRSGATSIPEALRMVPGLEVAQAASNRWAISARGFNGVLANKLLVMIDGRTVYTPVFSGTYWDDQSTLLEDIDRIEVIRGPGASLWGANAVNGIINIITKRAADTQGNYVSAAAGTEENFVEGRHGGKTGENTYYRAYARYAHYDETRNLRNQDNVDDWYRARSGFRVDTKSSDRDTYMFQGNVYGGEQGAQATLFSPTSPFANISITDDKSFGGNLLARWNRTISDNSAISLQTYASHYSRLEANVTQHVSTAGVEFQHNIRPNERNNFIWGTGARVSMEDLQGTFSIDFNDQYDNHEVVNAFLQDEYALVLNKLYLTLGSKFEHNDYTGFEFQPSARISWLATDTQTLWAAVSRAVRTPSSYEEDVSVAAAVRPGSPPTVLRIFGSPAQDSEELLAYELGHRIQATRTLSFDNTVFYNRFSDLQTFALPGTPFLSGGTRVIPYVINNLGSGHVYGAETVANWNVTPSWRLTGSYSYLQTDLTVKPGTAVNLRSTERQSPNNQFSIRSYWNVTDKVQWDNMLYYVADIVSPADTYLRYDTRLGWEAMPGVTVSVIGRNLLENAHPEFPATPQAEIERSFLGQVSWRF